ncbi:penicillin-binding transpeptidase domain-containing protein [Paenibacillus sp. JX-17]|uniref:Penicillin-binding transpeptidase domain-containing protein n=1 Tax=Paenibacillus lacisoli TaxID=3064525 RepID=A0ABT9CCL5_9BACL|nr:penicillin-binding transpeptidase domain-containing protein [Paenibacillus sp. JX-17]MDO7905411.1 penicillin-binding transpeptidase domain-containing protein [Paenibacillus sp. JX-17]
MIKRIKLRALFLGGCISLFFLVLLVRVFWIQVVEGAEWRKELAVQVSRSQVIEPVRGTITDRNGNVLATDAPAYTVVVNPAVINEKKLENVVVDRLNQILGKSEDELMKDVTAQRPTKEHPEGELYPYREVRTEGYKVDKSIADQVEQFQQELQDKYKVTGAVVLKNESKRYYPENTLAAHVIGYLDRQGNAVSGLEKFYDKQLKGTPGSLTYQSDRTGVRLPNQTDNYKPVQNGKNFKLTTDDTIQYYIEDAIKEAVNEYHPLSMSVIAADPQTMEILGMANYPTFNPNNYWDYGNDIGNFYNHATQSMYEPGSTFKIVTLAAAVQEKLFNANATYKSGSIRVPGRTIHDSRRDGWGTISFLDGVKHSSNVAFVKLGYEMLGGDRLRKYIDNFGFGVKTGIDLPNETAAPIQPFQYSADIAAASYGQGKVQVTPIQQMAAISAIANGGKLLQPHLVKQITDPESGKVIEEIKPKLVRQVVSPETAKQTGLYLEQVVADQDIGTGKLAYIDGYRVAGKTGTAYKQTAEGYGKKYVISFIGFAPVENPKIAVLVVMDEPKDDVYGGQAAAPVFKKIVSQSLQYMGVPKRTSGTDTSSTKSIKAAKAPDLKGQNSKDAQNLLLNQGLAYEVVGKGTKVLSQYPPKDTAMLPGQRVYLITENSKTMAVPDLKGVSLRDALEILTLMKIGVQVKGEGYVASQTEQKAADGQRTVALTLMPAKETVTGISTEDSSSGAASVGSDSDSASADNKSESDAAAKEETGKQDQTNGEPGDHN